LVHISDNKLQNIYSLTLVVHWKKVPFKWTENKLACIPRVSWKIIY